MTRSEHDIRDALNAKADEAARSVDLPRAAPRPVLRRDLPIAGAVVAAAAVAIAVPLAVVHTGSGKEAASPPATTPTGHPDDMVEVRLADGTSFFSVGDYSPPCPDGRRQPTPPCAHASIYAEGTFRASDVADAVPVTVGGRPALFGRVALYCAPPTPSVAYEQTSGQWVVLQGTSPALQTKDAELQIAKATMSELAGHFDSPPGPAGPTDHKVSYRFGYLPSTVCGDWGINPTTMRVVFDNASDIGVGPYVLRADYRSEDHRTTLITQIYGPNALPGQPPTPPSGSTPVQVAGHVAHVGANTIDVTVGPYTFHVTYSGPAARPHDLLRIAQSMQFPSNIADPSTWFSEDAVAPPPR
jgi:hypothetical protein